MLSAKFQIFCPDGKVAAVGIISTDITESKRREDAVRQSEAMLRSLSSNLPAMVYQFQIAKDGALSFPFVSKRVTELFGVSAERAMADGRALFD